MRAKSVEASECWPHAMRPMYVQTNHNGGVCKRRRAQTSSQAYNVHVQPETCFPDYPNAVKDFMNMFPLKAAERLKQRTTKTSS